MPTASSVPGSNSGIEKWIADARQGSADALGRLLEACRPYLLLIGRQELPVQLRPKLGASDLVQDTLFNAQRGFQEFRGCTEAELRAWLKQILVNEVTDASRRFSATHKRAVSREVRLEEYPGIALGKSLKASEPSPSQQALARERDQAMERALSQLPKHYYEVIRLRQQERCSFEEIGRRLDRSAEAVRKLWTRAVFQLKALLEGNNDSC